MESVRTLVIRYPYVLSKTTEELEHFFQVMKGQGINEEESMKALLECPKLISRHELEKQIKEIQFLFNLYHQISQEEVNQIFLQFPYLYLCELNKVQKFMGEFRKYRFTKEQVINVCRNSGGILASRVSNMVGLFDLLKRSYNIKASDVVEIIDTYPEFIL
jgi:mTERF